MGGENVVSSDNFSLTLDVHRSEVASHRFCEIPVSGPGLANRLVIITGIAIPAADILPEDDLGNEVFYHGKIHIKTEFVLNSPDQWLDIVDGNKHLLQTTYVTLASIHNESETAFIYGVDEASTRRNSDDGRIQVNIRVGLQGDITLERVAYQSCFLFRKVELALSQHR